mmetsp:Transcript_25269/g.53657  ORF Transcript_25269/g.53657 Transcript_25269/m.53657 type:complete len:91 (+) Transcript_25269:608-880(+)
MHRLFVRRHNLLQMTTGQPSGWNRQQLATVLESKIASMSKRKKHAIVNHIASGQISGLKCACHICFRKTGTIQYSLDLSGMKKGLSLSTI